MDECDVLVVGAGPTGLMMGAELARYGLTCRVIDKSQVVKEQSKALAIQPRTLEILHFLGIGAEFLQKGQEVRAMNPISWKKPIGHIEFSSLNSPFPFILSLPQYITEQILKGYLESLGPKVERGLELVGLKEDDSGVIAEIRTPSNGKVQTKAKWVVGCDGAHSFVRKYLDLPFTGKSFETVFSLADIQIDWKYPHDEVFAFFSPEGVLAAIPLPQKNHYRLIFLLDRCQNKYQKVSVDNLQVDLPPPSLEEVEKMVWEHADPKAVLSNPQWLANFHVNSRLTCSYHVGKFFLAGDAAHIHSPIGGQGMNTGLQDAFNLAWKIALVHQRKASPHVLNSYQDERHAVARHLLKGTEVGTHIATLKKHWEISLRNLVASFALQIPFVKNKLIHALTQVSITYPTSRIINEKGRFKGGVKAGSRVPDHRLKDGDKNIQLYDLLIKLNSFFVILFLGKDHPFKNIEQLSSKLQALSIPVKTIAISMTPTQNRSGFLFDAGGEMHRVFAAQEGACYVVRPDTYIGYRQTPIDPQALIAYFDQYF